MNTYLNEFYKANARTDYSQAHTLASAMKIADSLIGKIRNEDSRYHADMVSVGSMGAHVPSVNFSECDVLYPVSIDGFIEQTDNPEYVKFKLSESAKAVWSDCTDQNGYLDPQLFSSTFYSLVEQCLQSTVDSKTRVNLTGRGTVAATIEFLCPFVGVSVDVVVTVRCKVWPHWAKPEWFKDSERVWPKKGSIEAIEHRGIELVANHFGQEKGVWRLSFSFAETRLLDDCRALLPAFRKLLIIFKALRILHMVKPSVGDASEMFKSYHFKVLMLHEAVEFPDSDQWSEDKLSERFLSVIEKLKRCIQEKHLKHLFLPPVNLFNYPAPAFLLQHELLRGDPIAFMEKVRTKKKKNKNNYFY